MPFIEQVSNARLPLAASLEKTAWALTSALLWFALIVALVTIAIQVARKFRGRNAKDAYEVSETLTNFRELHARGGLSDEEYRTIKSKLAGSLKSEIGDD